MSSNSKLIIAMLSAVLAIGGSAPAAIIFSTGFESPALSTGSIYGQNGWVAPGYSTGNATIQTSIVNTGSQALQTAGIGAGVATYARHSVNANVNGQIVTFEFDFYHGSGASFTQSGLAIYSASADDGSNFIAQIDHINNNYVIGNTNSSSTIPGATDNTWHHFILTMNFQTLSMTGSVDAVSIAPRAINNAIPPSTIGDIELFTSGGGADSYFDNFTIDMIPEPTCLGLLPIAALTLTRRRARNQEE